MLFPALFVTLFAFLSTCAVAKKLVACPDLATKAVALLQGNSAVTGIMNFTQSVPTGPVTVTGRISNLDPNALRGFHVHQFGDLTGGCDSAGGHFNPFNSTHGGRNDTVRHVGDFGNLESDANGVASFSFEVDLLSLNGPASIIGRAIVVHSGTDDLGRGGVPASLTTGNSGSRIACGVIGLV